MSPETEPDAAPPARSPSSRAIDLIELAAAAALTLLTILVCASITGRWLFNAPIPDSFDLSRLFLGIAVFWGIAAACARDDYIRGDIIWPYLPSPAQAIVDWLGRAVILAAFLVLTWKLYDRTLDVQRTNTQTSELGLPIWPFYVAAWVALLFALVAVAWRFWRAVRRRELDPSQAAPETESRT